MPRWQLPVTLGLLFLTLGAGYWQSAATTTRWHAQRGGMTFALIQPSLVRDLTPQALVDGISDAEILRRQRTLIALSRRSVALPDAYRDGAPLILWPESALPDPPSFSPDVMSMSRTLQSNVLIGAVAYLPPTFDRPRNSAFLLGPQGFELGRYDKIHLVPFGEFVPLRRGVNWLREQHIVPDVRENDMAPGDAWTPLTVNNYRIGVGICFESTVSAIARCYARQHVQYLVYLTNDAWLHRTSAVQQHFNHARFRALETGLPVARVASTGISGAIAPDGRSVCEIPTYAMDTRTVHLAPGAPGTVYTCVGWLFGPFCLLASLLLLAWELCRSRQKSSRNSTS
jgi:apolipoprotein N-acyltransferase